MNTTILWFILPLMVMLALFFRVLKANSPQSPFIRTLRRRASGREKQSISSPAAYSWRVRHT